MSGSPDDEFSNSTSESADDNWYTVVQAHYDHEEPHDLTTTIILAIAEAEGVAPTAIKSPRLYDTIDVPALEDTLFSAHPNDPKNDVKDSHLFQYGDYQVCVQADGWVFVREPLER